MGVHLLAQSEHRLPLPLGIRPSDPGRFEHACDLHVVVERHLGFVHQALDGCGAGRRGRARQRNVAFSRQQA